MRIVLDASMAIAWIFDDERTEAAIATFRLVADQGAIVPSLWALEVANVMQVAVRRGRCNEAFVDESLADLSRMPIVTDTETSVRAWRETLALAREERLTVYDGAYLELAVRERLPLATADAALAAAAERRNLMVLRR